MLFPLFSRFSFRLRFIHSFTHSFQSNSICKTQCAEGHDVTSRLCARCLRGYFSFGSSCLQVCPFHSNPIQHNSFHSISIQSNLIRSNSIHFAAPIQCPIGSDVFGPILVVLLVCCFMAWIYRAHQSTWASEVVISLWEQQQQQKQKTIVSSPFPSSPTSDLSAPLSPHAYIAMDSIAQSSVPINSSTTTATATATRRKSLDLDNAAGVVSSSSSASSSSAIAGAASCSAEVVPSKRQRTRRGVIQQLLMPAPTQGFGKSALFSLTMLLIQTITSMQNLAGQAESVCSFFSSFVSLSCLLLISLWTFLMRFCFFLFSLFSFVRRQPISLPSDSKKATIAAVATIFY